MNIEFACDIGRLITLWLQEGRRSSIIMFLKMFHNPGAGPLEKVHFVVLFLGGKKKQQHVGRLNQWKKGHFGCCVPCFPPLW